MNGVPLGATSRTIRLKAPAGARDDASCLDNSMRERVHAGRLHIDERERGFREAGCTRGHGRSLSRPRVRRMALQRRLRCYFFWAASLATVLTRRSGLLIAAPATRTPAERLCKERSQFISKQPR